MLFSPTSGDRVKLRLRLAPNTGTLIVRIGFPLKGSLKGVYKGSIVGFNNIGALIIRIRFWGPIYYNHIKEPAK